ncbi:hypothetical protein J2S31_002455 [Nitrospina gracilis Nb-211]|nr:hypothetical protein [Nitrospina gracilis Nb-211]
MTVKVMVMTTGMMKMMTIDEELFCCLMYWG